MDDKDEKLLLHLIGSADHLPVKPEQGLLLKDAILVHNHPSNGPLSPQDVFQLYKHKMYEVRAVTDRGIFCVTNPQQWKQIPTKEAMIQVFHEKLDVIKHGIKRRVSAGKMSDEQRDYLLCRLGMRAVERKFGFEMRLQPWKET